MLLTPQRIGAITESTALPRIHTVPDRLAGHEAPPVSSTPRQGNHRRHGYAALHIRDCVPVQCPKIMSDRSSHASLIWIKASRSLSNLPGRRSQTHHTHSRRLQ